MKQDFKSTKIFNETIKTYRAHKLFGLFPLPFNYNPNYLLITLCLILFYLSIYFQLEILGLSFLIILAVEFERATIGLEAILVEYYWQVVKRSTEIVEELNLSYDEASQIQNDFTDDERAQLLRVSIERLKIQQVGLNRITNAGVIAAIVFYAACYLLSVINGIIN